MNAYYHRFAIVFRSDIRRDTVL